MYTLSAELSFITKLKVRVCSPETLDRAMGIYNWYLRLVFDVKLVQESDTRSLIKISFHESKVL